jgi:hypothetical protein
VLEARVGRQVEPEEPDPLAERLQVPRNRPDAEPARAARDDGLARLERLAQAEQDRLLLGPGFERADGDAVRLRGFACARVRAEAASA